MVLPAPVPTLTPLRGDLGVCQQAKDPGLPLTQSPFSDPAQPHLEG